MRLLELVDIDPDIKIDKAVLANCSEILHLYSTTRQVLYRGILRINSARAKSIFIGEPVENRIPLNTSLALSIAIDNKLIKAGFKALRINSIFCTGDLEQAKEFGEPYVIFPFNGFKFTYSDFKDLTLQMPYKFEPYSNMPKEIKWMTVADFISKFGFTNQNLDAALINSKEIYVRGKYLAINLQHNYNLLCEILGFKI